MTKGKNMTQIDELKKIFSSKKRIFIPYIGSDYRKEKILVIGNEKEYFNNKILSQTKKGYCDFLMTGNGKKNQSGNGKRGELKKLQETIAKQLLSNKESEEFFLNRLKKIAYHNFVYDAPLKDYPQQGPSGKTLNIYLKNLKDVLDILKPKKIFFLKKSTFTLIKRCKRPIAFDGKTLEEFLSSKSVPYEIISPNKNYEANNDEAVIKKIADDLNEAFSTFYEEILRSLCDEREKNKFKSIIKDLEKNPSNDKYIEGSTDLDYMCILEILRRIKKTISRLKSKQYSSEQKNTTTFKVMLKFLHDQDLYVANRFVPTLLKYIDSWVKHVEGNFETSVDEIRNDRDSFVKWFKGKNGGEVKIQKGFHKVLKSIHNQLRNGDKEEKKYCKIMEKRIFEIDKKYILSLDNGLYNEKCLKNYMEKYPNNFKRWNVNSTLISD